MLRTADTLAGLREAPESTIWVKHPEGAMGAHFTMDKALQDAWNASGTSMAEREAQEKALIERGDMLALYRYINTPESMRVNAEHNIVGPTRAAAPERYPQMWVAGWETRNLRMVANIREAFRERPGARVLSIVGVAHKPWFDGWLGQLQGVDIVDAQQVLK